MKQKVSLRLLGGVRVQQPGCGPDHAELAQAALHAPDGRRPLSDAAVRGQGIPRHLRSVVVVGVVGGGAGVVAWWWLLRRTAPPSPTQPPLHGPKCQHAHLRCNLIGATTYSVPQASFRNVPRSAQPCRPSHLAGCFPQTVLLRTVFERRVQPGRQSPHSLPLRSPSAFVKTPASLGQSHNQGQSLGVLEWEVRVFGEGGRARRQGDGQAQCVLARVSPVAVRERLPVVFKG